jgi:hypothetical protein
MQMPRIAIPDDAPAILRASAQWPALAARATVDYHDTLPGSEDRLIERIGRAPGWISGMLPSSSHDQRFLVAWRRIQFPPVSADREPVNFLWVFFQRGRLSVSRPASSAPSGYCFWAILLSKFP